MSYSLKTVAIIYGWAEGSWLATRFADELGARGLVLVEDAATADIIFAHSSGCYQIPKDARAKLVLLVGLPYGPVYRLAIGVMRKEIEELKYHHRQHELRWWFKKLLRNGWYIVAKPRATYAVIVRHKIENLPSCQDRRVLLVRPEDDTLMYVDTDTLLNGLGYEAIETAGTHDACWVKPRPYVDLIARE